MSAATLSTATFSFVIQCDIFEEFMEVYVVGFLKSVQEVGFCVSEIVTQERIEYLAS